VEVTERRRFKRAAADVDGQALPLESWLLSVGGKPEVSHVTIYKYEKNERNQLTWLLLPRRIETPCDEDPANIFREYGDGAYRFSAVKADHSGFYTHKREDVTGYGPGTRGPGASASAAPAEDPIAKMQKDMNDFMRQQIAAAQLRAMYRELVGAGAGGGSSSPAEDGAVAAATFDSLVDKMVKLRTAFYADAPRAGGGALELLMPIIGDVLKKAITPEPAEKSLDTVSKVMEFTDRLTARAGGGGAGPDLGLTEIAMLMLLSSLAQSPQAKEMVGKLVEQIGARIGFPVGVAVARAETAAARVDPLPSVAETAATPAPAPGVPGPAPGPGPEKPQITILRTIVYPMLRRAIELKSDDFESYERIIENHLPGFLNAWIQGPLEDALLYVRGLDPEFLSTLEAREWLSAFYRFCKEPADTPPA